MADRLRITKVADPRGTFRVELDVRNVGFASPHMPREVALVLSQGDRTHASPSPKPTLAGGPLRPAPSRCGCRCRYLPMPAAADGGWPCNSRTPRRAWPATAGTRSASPTKGSPSTKRKAGTYWSMTWKSDNSAARQVRSSLSRVLSRPAVLERREGGAAETAMRGFRLNG